MLILHAAELTRIFCFWLASSMKSFSVAKQCCCEVNSTECVIVDAFYLSTTTFDNVCGNTTCVQPLPPPTCPKCRDGLIRTRRAWQLSSTSPAIFRSFHLLCVRGSLLMTSANPSSTYTLFPTPQTLTLFLHHSTTLAEYLIYGPHPTCPSSSFRLCVNQYTCGIHMHTTYMFLPPPH